MKNPEIAIISVVILIAFGGYMLIWPRSIQRNALERHARGEIGWNGWLLGYTRSKSFIVSLRKGGLLALSAAALIIATFMKSGD